MYLVERRPGPFGLVPERRTAFLGTDLQRAGQGHELQGPVVEHYGSAGIMCPQESRDVFVCIPIGDAVVECPRFFVGQGVGRPFGHAERFRYAGERVSRSLFVSGDGYSALPDFGAYQRIDM